MDSAEDTLDLPFKSHGLGNGPLDLEDEDDSGLMPAHPAATLIIYHEGTGADRSPVLMVRRSAKMKFAAGAAVFPGGRVDDDDAELAARIGLHLERGDAAARIAAIRETLEETGLAVALQHNGDLRTVEVIREGLHAGEKFSDLLQDANAQLDLTSLSGFSRWRPNFEHSRLFDTRFYLTRISGPVPDLSVSHGENTHLFWVDPATALARAAAEEIQIIFPTRRNLERLALYRGFEQARAAAERFPMRRVIPFVAEIDSRPHLCIREDCGYPVTSEPVDTALK